MEKDLLKVCINLLVEAGEIEDLAACYSRQLIESYSTKPLLYIPDNISDIFDICLAGIVDPMLEYINSKWKESILTLDNEEYIKNIVTEELLLIK